MRDSLPPTSDNEHFTSSLTFILVSTMLVQTICSMGLMAMAFIAPLVAADLGVPAWIVGLQVGFIYLWAMLASPLAGDLVSRWGAAKASQYALIGVACGCLLCASGNLPLMVVGSALAGVTYSLTNPAASHILNTRAPTSALNIIFAVKQSGVPFGWALAGLTLPTLATAYGWRSGLIGISAIMLTLAVVLHPARRTWRGDAKASAAARHLLSHFRIGFDGDRMLLAYGVAGFLYSGIQIVVATYLVTALVEEAHWSPVAAGTGIAVMQFSGTMGRLMLAGIADYFSIGTLMLVVTGVGTAIAVLLTGILMLMGNTTLVFAIIGMLGFFSMSWNGTMLAQVAHLSPPGRVGTMTSRVMIYYYSGCVAGPWLFSVLFGLLKSYSLSYALFAVLPLAGAAAILLAYLGDRRASA